MSGDRTKVLKCTTISCVLPNYAKVSPEVAQDSFSREEKSLYYFAEVLHVYEGEEKISTVPLTQKCMVPHVVHTHFQQRSSHILINCEIHS